VVDVATGAISLFDPKNFVLPLGTKWSKMRFEHGVPTVEATCAYGETAWYRVDTGDPGTVTFHSPFVEDKQLLSRCKTTPTPILGVEGSSQARQGKLDWFELAGQRFDHPDVIFSQASEGACADRYLAGNIGQKFMKPFEMVFDFGNQRIAFVKKTLR
jgi:hypothetical protein